MACVAVTLIFSLLQEPVYEAAAEFELPAATAPELPGESSDVAMAVARLQSEEIAGRVRTAVGAAPRVVPEPLDETQIIRVRVQDRDAHLAAAAATTYATVYLADRKEKALTRVDQELAPVRSRLEADKTRHAEIWNAITGAPLAQRDVLRERYSFELAEIDQAVREGGAQVRELLAKRAAIEQS